MSTMTRSQDLQNQIYLQEQRRREAELAEHARQNAERQNQLTIDEANHKIANLRRQQAVAQFEESLPRNVELVNRNADACDELMKALTTVADLFVQHVGDTPKKVIDTFTLQQRFADSAANNAAYADNPDPMQANIERHKYFGRLPNAMSLEALLGGWIAEAQNEQIRRLRTSLAYTLVGYEIFAEKGSTARTINEAQVNLRRTVGGMPK